MIDKIHDPSVAVERRHLPSFAGEENEGRADSSSRIPVP